MLYRILKDKKRIIIYALCTAAVVAALSMMIMICTVKVNLTLYIDGAQIGSVSDAAEVEAIRARVIEDVSKVAYGQSFPACSISYGFAEGSKASDTLSEGEIYRAIYVSVLKNYRSAYGLYVNGEFVAANADSSVISDAVAEVREAAQGEDNLEVELTGTLEVRSLYYPVASLRAGSEISSMLTQRAGELYRTVSAKGSSIVSVDIDASEDEIKFFGSDGGQVISSDTGDDGIVTVNIKVTETVPFTTEYRRNDDLYVGTYEKTQDGADGEKEVVYCITYKDGTPVLREKVSENVILEPIAKIIDEGTKTKPVTASKDKYIWPIKDHFDITDTFGGRTVYGRYSYHYAIDLATRAGTPIYAADGGVVTTADRNSSYGYYVIIKHDNGQETLYAHMQSEPLVSVGERVYQGQQIGEVGMTGYATGYHLHFEVRVNGEKVDPLDYLPER
ncbi:MAG: peptidoglycan DD-metalloendopeptidase family protein [Clostridia bacterium]|nr:peptidoglycan DD-metalloendopeptidase family protein [Clostridia bacterium]